MTRCLRCRAEVPVDAHACPSCGHTSPEQSQRQRAAKKPASMSAGLGCLALLALPVVLILMCAGPPQTEAERTADREAELRAGDGIIDAFVMCQQFVERALRAPSTAKFPWGAEDLTTFIGNGAYRVRAYVDAQNGFGAMIRTPFTCEIKYVGNKEWQLNSLDI